jgi:hypothetical protein
MSLDKQELQVSLKLKFDRQAAGAKVSHEKTYHEKRNSGVIIYDADRMGLAGKGSDAPDGRIN